MLPKPTRPPEPPDEDNYDSGDPYGCIAAGAAGVGKPTMIYRVGQCYEKRQPLTKLVQEDLASVKVALYDLWNSGRYHKHRHKEGTWAAQQMALLGDSSLVDYDRQVPPNPG